MSEKLFNVGVKAVIIQDDEVLIVKNTKGFWEVPGGRIDADESIEQALHRELHEELPNIDSIVLEKVLDASRLDKDIKDNVSLVLIFYKVTADFDGEFRLSPEHSGYKWANKNEALDLVYDSCKDAIRNAFKTN